MAPADIDAIIADLRSVPAIRNEGPARQCKAQQGAAPLPGADKPMSDAALKDPVKRGFYLSSIAHCMACHSRVPEAAPPDFKNAYGKGGREFRGPFGTSGAADISAHPKAGLGGGSG